MVPFFLLLLWGSVVFTAAWIGGGEDSGVFVFAGGRQEVWQWRRPIPSFGRRINGSVFPGKRNVYL